MAFLNKEVLDAALNEVANNATTLHICSSQPVDFAGIDPVSLGTTTTLNFIGPLDGTFSGRRITIDTITDGSVTGTNTATHWALEDGMRLLAAGILTNQQVVTDGNTFTLSAFDIEIQDPEVD